MKWRYGRGTANESVSIVALECNREASVKTNMFLESGGSQSVS